MSSPIPTPPGLQPVRLETRDGHLVAEKSILPFLMLPDVLTWGIRTFRLASDGQVAVYRECFAFSIVDFDGPAPVGPEAPAGALRQRFPTGDAWIDDGDGLSSAFEVEAQSNFAVARWAHRRGDEIARVNGLPFPTPAQMAGAAEAMWRLAARWDAQQRAQAKTDATEAGTGGCP